MVNVVVRRALGVVALAGGAALLNASARYASSKRMDASQKLADALLQIDRLKEASEIPDNETEAALAACSAYLINVAHQAAHRVALVRASGPHLPQHQPAHQLEIRGPFHKSRQRGVKTGLEGSDSRKIFQGGVSIAQSDE